MNAMNFIPRHLRGRHSARRSIRRWCVTLGVYGALLVIGCVAVSIPVGADPTNGRADLERLNARVSKAEKDRETIEKDVATLRTRLSAARAVGEHPDWSVLLWNLAQAGRDEIVVESFQLTTGKVGVKAPPTDKPSGDADKKAKPREWKQYTVKLTGHSVGPGGVFAFARRVEEFGLFDSVNVKDTKAAAIKTLTTTRFEIEAVLTEAPEAAR